jgi:hypothetical protein
MTGDPVHKRGRPRAISELLQTSNISRLSNEARQRRELAAAVRSALPREEAEHVVSAHVDEADRLVVGMDSAAWAARLRYAATELLGKPVKVRVTAPGADRAEG